MIGSVVQKAINGSLVQKAINCSVVQKDINGRDVQILAQLCKELTINKWLCCAKMNGLLVQNAINVSFLQIMIGQLVQSILAFSRYHPQMIM